MSWLQIIHHPRVRGLIVQGLLAVAIIALLWFFIGNGIHNVAKRHLTTGFGFLGNPAGFGIDQTLIAWTPTDTYARALLIGIINTLCVSSLAVIFSTILGVVVGLMRLSSNGLSRALGSMFVELVRNTPSLLQIVFWYFAVLQPLPPPRQSFNLGGGILLNVRGLYLPEPTFTGGGVAACWTIAFAFALGLLGLVLKNRLAERKARLVGSMLILAAGTVAAAILFGQTMVSWDLPQQQGFNLAGGIHVYPEFIALLLGLTIYFTAFIAEIVRAGILSVDGGQIEAARSLGLRHSHILRLVVIPQALRVIIPPLTSEYLSIVKASSLAVAIAYPDIAQIFAGTVLNQSGQAIEVMAITMAVYLSFSLLVSFVMNLYNRRVAVVER